MNVSLTDELEDWIESRVASGLYRSSSEVVREALRLLREREAVRELHREEVRRAIQRGLDDVENGRTEPFTEETVASIKQRGRQRLARAKNES